MLHPTLMKMPAPEKRADKMTNIDAKISNRGEYGREKPGVQERNSFQEWYAKQDKAARSDLKKGQTLPAERAHLATNSKLDRVEKPDVVKAESSMIVDSVKGDNFIGPGLVHKGFSIDSINVKQGKDLKDVSVNEEPIQTDVSTDSNKTNLAGLSEESIILSDSLNPVMDSKEVSNDSTEELVSSEHEYLDETKLTFDSMELETVLDSDNMSKTEPLVSAFDEESDLATKIDGNELPNNEEFESQPLRDTLGPKDTAVIDVDSVALEQKPESALKSEPDLTMTLADDADITPIKQNVVLNSEESEETVDDESAFTEESETLMAANENNTGSQKEQNPEKDDSLEKANFDETGSSDGISDDAAALVAVNTTAKPDTEKVSPTPGAAGEIKNTIQGEASKTSPESDRSMISERIKQFSGEQSMQMGQGEKLTLEQLALKDSGDHEQDFKQQVLQRVDVAKKIVEIPVRQPVGHADWAKSIGDRMMMMVSRNMKVANIRLDPPNLGLMEVKITMGQDQQTQITFVSQHAQVREVLEAESPRLRQMLEEQGLGQVDVDISDRKEQESPIFSDGRGSNESEGDGVEGDEEPVEQISLGMVDHYV